MLLLACIAQQWLRGLIHEFLLVHVDSTIQSRLESTTLFCDNQAAITLSNSQKHHQRTKHMNVRFHYLRDLVNDNVILMQWISTQFQQADLFTKPLGTQLFTQLRKLIMDN